MSYQVLARQYRPKNFDTLVGQEHVVRALTHALQSGRLHHAYLFTGTRGVGKTTLSRILAKSLNCESGITAQPCGVCEACAAIDAGCFIDYIEMDAASNRGVDEMAQLLEQAVYAPSNARFKVYMIDEVHMLTSHAFNSMLKTLEEPPPHVKFILATTDPQKIPVTVLSRCLQFNLKQMPPSHIVSHLDHVLTLEKIEFDVAALRLLAQGAHGSMRDALSLTDQAIAYAAGKVTLETVQSMLGVIDQAYLIRLLDALAQKNGTGLLAIADEMLARSLSYNGALQDLGVLLHRIALAQAVPDAVPDDLPERDDILRFATLFDAEEVQLFYQIVLHGRNDLSLAPDEYVGFSMTLLRMLAFKPDNGTGNDVASVAREMPLALVETKPVVAQQVVSPVVSPAPSAVMKSEMSPARAALAAARNLGKTASSNTATTVRLSDPIPSTPVLAVNPASVPDVTAAVLVSNPVSPDLDYSVTKWQAVPELNWDGNWPQLAASLPLRGVVQQLALQSELVDCKYDSYAHPDAQVCFHLKVSLETLCSSVNVDKITAALAAHFGQKINITTEVGPVRHTAHAQAQQDLLFRQRQAEDNIHSDPFVQGLIREFDAVIVPGSIKAV